MIFYRVFATLWLVLLKAGSLSALSLKSKSFHSQSQKSDELVENSFLPFVNMISSFPPYEDVREVFLFTSTGPLTVELQDAFCTGRNFSCWDNNVFLGTTVSIQNFCGISASSYAPIIEPSFVKVQYPLDAGYHNLTVFITDSPIGNGVASLRITLKPDEGVMIKSFQAFTERWPRFQKN